MKTTEVTRRARVALWLAFAGAAWPVAMGLVTNTAVAQNATVAPLMTMALARDPSKELAMLSVGYAPGGSTPVHTHHAQALVYVLEGSIVMQVTGWARRSEIRPFAARKVGHLRA